ncbi:MAG: hypothetical protein DRP11_00235 [Candidatus Aenigmatarchaeota archaeon]|mgnify:CR=1 FL=1|nr:MAG: hypothetical protein DRP11_00235 [Candidatus Aenigmarchaeota archaeon]
MLTEIDKKIIDILRNEPEPLTTYEVAKKTGIAWATANIHLKELQFNGFIKGRDEEEGGRKKKVWWVEQQRLDRFLKKV